MCVGVECTDEDSIKAYMDSYVCFRCSESSRIPQSSGRFERGQNCSNYLLIPIGVPTAAYAGKWTCPQCCSLIPFELEASSIAEQVDVPGGLNSNLH